MSKAKKSMPCPCGSGLDYEMCCAPLHCGKQRAVNATQLMRSRYSAYTLKKMDYIERTWDPETCPADLEPDSQVKWIDLHIHESIKGEANDSEGWVSFTARFKLQGKMQQMREKSYFKQTQGCWYYVRGV